MEMLFGLPALLALGLVALAITGGGSDGGGSSEIDGTEGDDTLSGRGDDVVNGLGGDDLLDGQDDARLFGGDGEDTITAADRVDAFGGAGRDSLTGSGAGVVLRGEQDGDSIIAEDGARAFGGGGNDRVEAHTGSTGFGGGGDDLLFADAADSTVWGEAGRDYLVVTDGTADGGTEDDWLSVGDAAATGTVSATGGEGNDVFALRDGAVAAGGIGADTFIGVVEEPLFSGAPESEVTITDFVPAADRLLISVGAPVSGYSIVESGGDTLVTVTTAAAGPDPAEGIVIRILGATGLTAANIGVVTDLSETAVRGTGMGISFGTETPLGP